MLYHYSKKLNLPFHAVVDKITGNLKEQGFGVLTSIDIKDTLKKKLGTDFRNYVILGACNPGFAYKAISLEPHIGVMLPCNIVIQDFGKDQVEVSAINPMETIEKRVGNEKLHEIAAELSNRLRKVVDNLP